MTATTYRTRFGTRTSTVVLALGVGLVAFLASLPLWGPGAAMRILIEFFVLLAMAQMWNLLAGYAGLVSIGQQAFVGVGAYALFALLDLAGLPIGLAVVGTALLAALIAAATSLFAFRLRDGYFAIGTWVIAEVFRLVITQVPQLGLGTGVSIQSLVSMDAGIRQSIAYWLALAVGVGAVVVVAFVMRSRTGLALAAIRDSEIGAAGLGVNVLRTKRVVYIVASVGCALAAAVYYMHLLRIQPTAAFSVDWTVQMIFIVVIGGLRRIEGPIVGAVIVVALQELLADYGSVYLIALGLVMIVVVMLAPRGVWGVVTRNRQVSLFATQRRLVQADDRS